MFLFTIYENYFNRRIISDNLFVKLSIRRVRDLPSIKSEKRKRINAGKVVRILKEAKISKSTF